MARADAWLVRLSEKYQIPVSRLDFSPREMEHEIAVLLADVVLSEARRIENLPATQWPRAYQQVAASQDWLDKLIAAKCRQMRDSKKPESQR